MLLLPPGVFMGYGLFRWGGVLETDRWILAIGFAALVFLYLWPRRRHELPPPLPTPLAWLLAAALLYIFITLVPLPHSWLSGLSPARSAAVSPLGLHWASLSSAPAQTLLVGATLSGCVLVFAIARQAAWLLGRKYWLAFVPLLALAVLQAALGLVQFLTNWPHGFARGTFVNRNHYAAFLAMNLALAAGMIFPSGFEYSPRTTLRRGLALIAAGLLLAGIVHSLSRMGFVSALAGLAVFALLTISQRYRPVLLLDPKRRRRFRLAAWASVLAGALVLFIYLPPDRLVYRFAELAATEELSADTRLQIWRETLPLIRDYLWLGCGAGSYAAAFYPYKTVAPLNTVDYVHNDYLQWLAELGVVGYVLWLPAIAWVYFRCLNHPAAFAALSAIALHSVVDFNTFIPANAFAIAWVAGLGNVH